MVLSSYIMMLQFLLTVNSISIYLQLLLQQRNRTKAQPCFPLSSFSILYHALNHRFVVMLSKIIIEKTLTNLI